MQGRERKARENELPRQLALKPFKASPRNIEKLKKYLHGNDNKPTSKAARNNSNRA